MADAEDLKSSGDFSSCGFDSHPGHHSLPRLVQGLFEPGGLLLPVPSFVSLTRLNFASKDKRERCEYTVLLD